MRGTVETHTLAPATMVALLTRVDAHLLDVLNEAMQLTKVSSVVEGGLLE